MSDKVDPPAQRDVSTSAMTGVTILAVSGVAFLAIMYSINKMDVNEFARIYRAEDLHMMKFLGKDAMKLDLIHNSGVKLVNVVWEALGLGDMRQSFEGWHLGNLYVCIPNAFLWCFRRVTVCMFALVFSVILCVYPWLRWMWVRRKNYETGFVQSPKGYDVGLTLLIAGTAYFFAYGFYFMPISGYGFYLVLFLAGIRFISNVFRGKFEYLIPLVFVACAQFCGIFGIFVASVCMVYGTILLTRNFPDHV